MPHQRIVNNHPVLCVTVQKLVDCGVPKRTIYTGIQRHKCNIVNIWPYHKEGKEVYLHYLGLSEKYRLLIDNNICHGVPAEKYAATDQFIENLNPPDKDRKTLNEFRYTDTTPIEPAKLPDLYKKCAILNLVNIANPKIAAQYGCKNMPDFWKFLLEQIRNTGLKMPNQSYFSLKRKALEYLKIGAEAVIDGRVGNINPQKVNEKVEQLLLHLFAKDNKPYFVKVWEQYHSFITGDKKMINETTGEVFDPKDIVDSYGNPIMISKTTVYNWIMRPINRDAVMKVRQSGLDFSSKQRPHAVRHAPNYSLSKITMDDIDVPFKMEDGTRVKAYQIFDTTSGALIGAAFSKDKNRDLFIDALRNMFTTIITNGWKMPAEIEVEQHISNTFKNDMLKAGEVFPFVRWCLGGNPQEKRAEGTIRRKKYTVQKERDGFQYRPFSRNEANRMNEDKNKKRYTYQQIVANEWEDIATYNNQKPTNKYVAKKYPNMTRLQILVNGQHPKLGMPDMHVLAWYVGNKTETTIRRSMYVIIKDEKYMLPSPEVLTNLVNYQVIASYISTGDTIDKVYLYQDGKYICECSLMQGFNESKFEQTEEDAEIIVQQQSYISKYDKIVRERRDWAQEIRRELAIEETVKPEAVKTSNPIEPKTKEPLLSNMSEEERLLVEKFGDSKFRKYN